MPIPQDKKYTANEFLQFVESSTERYELIDGEIVALASPSTIHQKLIGNLYFSIKSYIKSNKGKCEVMLSPFDVKLDDNNVVIPDISVICDTSKIDEKRCNGSPDWIIEVVSTNRSDDYSRKLALYQKFGVREYWIVDPRDRKVFVYFFEKGNNIVYFYDFSQHILANIYKHNLIQLSINIEELLNI